MLLYITLCSWSKSTSFLMFGTWVSQLYVFTFWARVAMGQV